MWLEYFGFRCLDRTLLDLEAMEEEEECLHQSTFLMLIKINLNQVVIRMMITKINIAYIFNCILSLFQYIVIVMQFLIFKAIDHLLDANTIPSTVPVIITVFT